MDNYDLKEVINAATAGMSTNAASQKLWSTEISLADLLKRKLAKPFMDPPPIVTKYEEQLLEKWMTRCSRKEAKHCRRTPFKNNIPGDGWSHKFRKRHPDLRMRCSASTSKGDAGKL
jgi:hypothetical protein